MADVQAPEKPRRRRWWIGFWLLGLMGLLIGAHAFWGWSEEKKLAGEMDQVRAKGEPLWVEDFQSKTAPVEREDNAAVLLKEAAASLSKEWSKDLGESNFELPMTARELDVCERLLAENSKSLKLVREARKRKSADWGIAVRPPMVKASLPDMDGQQNLQSMLGMGVFFAHQHRDDAEAVERLRDMLAISRAARGMPLFLSSFLVYSCGSTAERAWAIAPDLKIGEGGANEEAVRSLIDDLLDETKLRETQRWAARWIRAEHLETALLVRKGRLGLNAANAEQESPVERYFRKPIYTTEARLLLRHANIIVSAIEADNWPGFVQEASEATRIEDDVDRHGSSHPIAKILMPAGGVRMQFTGYRARVQVRLAATALALRLYSVQHGELPTRLEELVPKYLPSLPADLMDPTGKPMRYIANENRAVIYSLGQDGKDDGGSEKKVTGGYVGQWGMEDVVVELRPRGK